MIWNEHSSLRGRHAFLSPSKYHWVNYDEAKLIASYGNHQRAALGTSLHAWAEASINLKRRQPSNGEAINSFVNDAIGFHMETEKVLYYSENCFGSADAIHFDRADGGHLRIFDLKTGVSPASFTQLEIYAAIFCLEYHINPNDIDITLRIYQVGQPVQEYIPDPGDILRVIGTIRSFDLLVEEMKNV